MRILAKVEAKLLFYFNTGIPDSRLHCFALVRVPLQKQKGKLQNTVYVVSHFVKGKSQKHLLSFRISITPVILQSTETCFTSYFTSSVTKIYYTTV